MDKQKIKILYLSTFVPRKCGIATFCRDLIEGIEESDPSIIQEVAAMTSGWDGQVYPKRVKYKIRQEVYSDYLSLADEINKSDYNLFCLQHEFNIFGGRNGQMVLDFLDRINLPVVSILHTVLPEPTLNRKRIIKAICRKSQMIATPMLGSREILSKVYGVLPGKVEVIPHGVPDFKNLNQKMLKKKMGFEGKIVMGSVNLLSPVKGIEYAIKSVPEIVRQNPNFIYLVVGETHPVFVAKKGGDIYREKLINLVERLGISDHVKFINQYVSTRELAKFIQTSDFYITPYLDPGQASSGSLSYGIGAAKVCISTPYIYAKELLSFGRGVLVPFKNYRKISQAVCRFISRPDLMKQIQEKAREVGQKMSWREIGESYLELYKQVIETRGINEIFMDLQAEFI